MSEPERIAEIRDQWSGSNYLYRGLLSGARDISFLLDALHESQERERELREWATYEPEPRRAETPESYSFGRGYDAAREFVLKLLDARPGATKEQP